MKLPLRSLLSLAIVFSFARADEILHRYEANVLPYDPSAGWQVFNPCMGTCSESLNESQFVLTWSPSGGRTANYTRFIGGYDDIPAPAPPFWVEWRFASNNAIHGSFAGDGSINIGYVTALGELEMYGDAIISADGGTFVTDLPLNQFRTYRFESSDANHWCIWFDGNLFDCKVNGQNTGLPSYIQLYGHGESPTQTTNRWDFVRYGRVTTGETIVASNPPAGYLDPTNYPNLDRFTVTFDQPNYVSIDDIVVDGEGSEAARQPDIGGNEPRTSVRADAPDLMTQADFENPGADLFLKTSPQVESPRGMNSAAREGVPVVIATRRQDNGPPETVEIVLDRPLAAGATYRFTFNTGAATPQTITYTMTPDPHPVIPTTTTWGLVALTLLLAIAAKLHYGGLHPSV